MIAVTPIRAVLEERWLVHRLDDDLFEIIDELTPWYREDDAAEQWVDRTRTELQRAVKDLIMERVASRLSEAADHALPTREPRLRLDLLLVTGGA